MRNKSRHLDFLYTFQYGSRSAAVSVSGCVEGSKKSIKIRVDVLADLLIAASLEPFFWSNKA